VTPWTSRGIVAKREREACMVAPCESLLARDAEKKKRCKICLKRVLIKQKGLAEGRKGEKIKIRQNQKGRVQWKCQNLRAGRRREAAGAGCNEEKGKEVHYAKRYRPLI